MNDIQNSFRDVALEDGIGIWEAEAIDNYLVGNEYELLKCKDERVDWNNITFDYTNQFEMTFAFWDAKGTTFILPKVLQLALMLEEENEDQIPDWQYILEGICQRKQQHLFNDKQKNTIQNFLNYQKQKSPKNDWDEYDLLAFDYLIERWKD
ncbi:DUF6714 family protein [Chryseobacterium sp.]|uniref:DUF6714 family protein n=1 Tax=Chryseobacterium sp. TaxID=1871047 RepID=UPI00388F24A7